MLVIRERRRPALNPTQFTQSQTRLHTPSKQIRPRLILSISNRSNQNLGNPRTATSQRYLRGSSASKSAHRLRECFKSYRRPRKLHESIVQAPYQHYNMTSEPPESLPVMAYCVLEDTQNIDQRLEDLEIARRLLRRRRNALSLVARIPSELLSMIFRICINDTRKGITGTPITGWYWFSHVCFQWRAIALRDPSLWSHITFNQPAWVDEMITRSQGCPLTMHLTSSSYSSDTSNIIRGTIFEHSHRIRQLALTVPSERVLDSLVGHRHRTDLLASLEINIWPPPVASYILPNDLLGGNCPGLRSLSLTGCSVDWQSGLLSNLTVLSIQLTPSSTPTGTLPELFQALGKLSSLRDLTLKHCCAVWDNDQRPAPLPDPPICLPYLRSLRFVDRWSPPVDFFSGIRIPGECRLRLEYHSQDGDVEAMCSALANLRRQSLKTFSFNRMGISHILFQGGNEDDEHIVELEFSWLTWDHKKVISAFERICGLFDLSRLRSLTVRDLGIISPVVWVSAFSQSKEVEKIHIIGQQMDGLLAALERDVECQGHSIKFLPGLSTLHLEHVRVAELTFKHLVDCASARALHNFNIQQFIICRTDGLPEGVVAALKETGADVLWSPREESMEVSSASEETDGEDESAYGTDYLSLDEFDYQE